MYSAAEELEKRIAAQRRAFKSEVIRKMYELWIQAKNDKSLSPGLKGIFILESLLAWLEQP